MIAQRIVVSGNADMKARVHQLRERGDRDRLRRGGGDRHAGPRRRDAVAGDGGDVLADVGRGAEADLGAADRARRAPLGHAARHRRSAPLRQVRGGDPRRRAVDAQAAAPARRRAAPRHDSSTRRASPSFGDLPPISKAAGNIVVSGSTVGIDLEQRRGEGAVRRGLGRQRRLRRSQHVQASGRRDHRAAALGRRARARRDRRQPSRCARSQRRDVSPGGPQRHGHRRRLRAPADPRRHRPRPTSTGRWSINTKNLASKQADRGPQDQRRQRRHHRDARPRSRSTARASSTASAPTSRCRSRSAPADSGGGDRRVRLLIDDDARKRLGVGLDEVIGGTISALVSDAADGGGQHYDLDLRRARVVLPGVGWTKGVGVPAKLTFDLKPEGDGFAVAEPRLQGRRLRLLRLGQARCFATACNRPTSTACRCAPATPFRCA